MALSAKERIRLTQTTLEMVSIHKIVGKPPVTTQDIVEGLRETAPSKEARETKIEANLEEIISIVAKTLGACYNAQAN